jgi:hypothetical protein
MQLPHLTPTALERFETSSARTLPPHYLKLLTEQNGGPLRYDALGHSKASTLDRDFIEVPFLRGIGPTIGIQTARQFAGTECPEHCLIISSTEDYVIALNYQDSALMPSVWLYAPTTSFQLAPDMETFIQALTRSSPDFLFAVSATDDVDENEIPEVVEDILAEAINDIEVEQWDDTHSLLFTHPTWKARTESDAPATILLRPPADDGPDDLEFPEYPEVRWILEVDMGTRNAQWLHSLFDHDVTLIRAHSPIGALKDL